MGLDPLSTIGDVAQAAAAAAKLALQKDAEHNSPEMIAAKLAAEKQALADKVTKDVADWNLAEVRKDAAE